MSNDSAWNGIEKLKGSENYHTWQYTIRNLLKLNDYEKCIVSGTGAETDESKLRRAKARIELSIDPSVYVHIEKSTTAAETWTKLQELFQDRGLSRRIGLLRKLVTIRLESSDSMNQYISQMFETANKLNGIGFPVDDEWLGSILLAGLPNEFAPMIMGLESSGAKITADLIKSKLLDSEYNAKSNGSGSAFFGKGGKTNNNVKCFSCNKRGHKADKCPQKSGSKKNGKNPNKNGKDNKKGNATEKSAFIVTAETNINTAYYTKHCHEDEWFIDSGASQHMSPFETLFAELKSTPIKQISSASSNKIAVKGVDNVPVVIGDREIDFKEVLCVPDLTANLLSVAQIVKNGNTVTFNQSGCHIYNEKKQLVAETNEINGVYKLNVQRSKCFATMAQSKSGLMWHRKLGHINFADMCKMKNGLVNGIIFNERNEIEIKNCEVCKEGKQTRRPFPISTTRSDHILELIHSDLNGPMENRSIGGAKYILTFIDDRSRKMYVYFLKEKSEVFNRFVEFKAMVENETGRKQTMAPNT